MVFALLKELGIFAGTAVCMFISVAVVIPRRLFDSVFFVTSKLPRLAGVERFFCFQVNVISKI